MKKIIETSKNTETENKLLTKKEAKTPDKKEAVKRRRKAKKQDKLARWSGLILLVVLMLIGFLLWVGGEVNKELEVKSPTQRKTNQSVEFGGSGLDNEKVVVE